jgi:flavodoxin/NAD-dependent dihydropyrimidine dehydrogenase PreA subunit
MNISLVYFSQTGNTRKVTDAMADAFRQVGHTVTTVPLKKATPQDVIGVDLFGIATPCFTCHAPTPVKKFLTSLPKLNELKSFVIATSGGAPGKVLYDLTSRLRRRGAFVAGGFLVRGELCYPTKCLNGRFPGRPDDQDLAKAAQFATAIAEHISAGRAGTLKESRKDALKAGMGFYDITGLSTPDSLMRIFMPEPRVDPSLCSQCQQCAEACPVDNITLQPFPVLGSQCIRCYRCYTICPQKAFKMNLGFANWFLGILFNEKFERWFGDVKPDEELYPGKADNV